MANQKIRQEINQGNGLEAGTSGTVVVTGRGIIQLDTTAYSGAPLFYFEFVYSIPVGTTSYQIGLRRSGTSTDDVSITSGLTTDGSRHLFRSTSFTPAAGLTEYVVSLLGDGTRSVSLYASRIIVLQNETSITQTQTQIEIGERPSSLTNTAVADITPTKFWEYNAANWDGTKTFSVEVVWKTSAKNTCTITLCRTSDNAANVTIVSAGTNSTGFTRTRVAFTPVTGETYKLRSLGSTTKSSYIIECAKIIVDQSSAKDALFASQTGSIALSGGTAGSGQTNQALGQSFTAGSGYSTTRIDLFLQISNSPTDNAVLEVLTGSITGTVIATSSVSAASFPGYPGGWISFTFSSISLVGGTKYYLRLTRDGARDTTNNFTWSANGNSLYGSGGSYQRDNNSWSSESTTQDMLFKVYSTPVSGLTKLEPQYLLLNTADSNATGVQNYLTTWNSSEWDAGNGSITYYHAMDSDNASNSIKLRDVTAGADISNGTVTGSGQQVSAALGAFTNGNNLDCWVLNTTGVIAASRIIVVYAFVAGAQTYTSNLTATLSLPSAFNYPWRQLGLLSFVGVNFKNNRRSTAGTISYSGLISKSGVKALPSTVSFVGVIKDRIAKLTESTLSVIGSINDTINKTITAVLSFIGDVVSVFIHGGQTFTQAVSGAVSFSGSIIDAIGKLGISTLSFIGSTLKSTRRLIKSTSAFNFSTFGFFDSPGGEYISGANGQYNEVAQAFTATQSGNLKAIVFWLSKVNNPTGLAYAKLYNTITGTLGTDATPTGSAATTSVGVDISALPDYTTSPTPIQFDFTDNYPITAGQDYAVSLYYNGGASGVSVKVNTSLGRGSVLQGNASAYTPFGFGWDTGNSPDEDCYYGLIVSIPLTKQLLRAITAALSFAATILRAFPKALAATLSFVGAITKSTAKQVASVLSFVAALTKQTGYHLSGAVSFTATLLRAFPKALAGTLSFVGTIRFNINKLLASILSFIGTILKRIPEDLAATLSFIGTSFKKTSTTRTGTLSFSGLIATLKFLSQLLTGTISFVGSITKQIRSTLASALSFVGAITKRTSYHLTGSASFIGANLKRIASSVSAATLSFTGAITKRAGKLLTAALSFIGSITKQINKLVSGVFSFVGSFLKSILTSRTATLSFVGAFLKRIGKLLAAALSLTGTLLRNVSYHVSSTLSFIGNFVAQGGRQLMFSANLLFNTALNTSIASYLTSTLNIIGTFVKQLPKVLTGSLSFVGSFLKQAGKLNTATLSFLGAINLRTSKLLATTLLFAGALLRSVHTTSTAALSFVANLTRNTSKLLTAAVLSFIGFFTAVFQGGAQHFFQTLTATLAFLGAVSIRTATLRSATLSYAGAILKQTSKPLSGTLSFVAELYHSISKVILALLTFTGQLTKSIAKALASSLSYIARVALSISRSFIGALTFVGSFIHVFGKTFSGLISFSGNVINRISRALSATVGFNGMVSRTLFRVLSSVLSFSGSILRSIPQLITGLLSFIGSFSAQTVLTKLLTATVAFAGAVSLITSRLFDGAVSFTGLIINQCQKALTSFLGFISYLEGVIPSSFQQFFTGSLSFSGRIVRRFGHYIKISLYRALTTLRIAVPRDPQDIRFRR